MTLLYVGIGGAFGALARVLIVSLTRMIWGKGFPLGTLIINVVGSFFIGLFLGIQLKPDLFLLLGSGMLGGFTTFSTMHYEAVAILKERRIGKLFLYTGLTYGLAIGGCLLGYFLMIAS